MDRYEKQGIFYNTLNEMTQEFGLYRWLMGEDPWESEDFVRTIWNRAHGENSEKANDNTGS